MLSLYWAKNCPIPARTPWPQQHSIDTIQVLTSLMTIEWTLFCHFSTKKATTTLWIIFINPCKEFPLFSTRLMLACLYKLVKTSQDKLSSCYRYWTRCRLYHGPIMGFWGLLTCLYCHHVKNLGLVLIRICLKGI